MKESPIKFNDNMVLALLSGHKTQTRRIAHQFDQQERYEPFKYLNRAGNKVFGKNFDGVHELSNIHCPYGQPGDRLWVQEAWRTDPNQNGQAASNFKAWPVRYEADNTINKCGAFYGSTNGTLRKPLHMPRWASRILLEVTDIRVERLQDISEADSVAEGGPPRHPNGTACGWFQKIWEQINGDGSWNANPWVWVIEFKRILP